MQNQTNTFIVRLVVLPNKESKGSIQPFDFDEDFIGDDETKQFDENERSNQIKKYFIAYYQNPIHRNKNITCSFLSVSNLGLFYSETNNWVCKLMDLSSEELALHEILRILYPDCEVRLLTFKP